MQADTANVMFRLVFAVRNGKHIFQYQLSFAEVENQKIPLMNLLKIMEVDIEELLSDDLTSDKAFIQAKAFCVGFDKARNAHSCVDTFSLHYFLNGVVPENLAAFDVIDAIRLQEEIGDQFPSDYLDDIVGFIMHAKNCGITPSEIKIQPVDWKGVDYVYVSISYPQKWLESGMPKRIDDFFRRLNPFGMIIFGGRLSKRIRKTSLDGILCEELAVRN